jgi:hypothetical protein
MKNRMKKEGRARKKQRRKSTSRKLPIKASFCRQPGFKLEVQPVVQEIQNYLAELDDLRNQVKGLLEGLPQEALDWYPIQGEGDLATNSLSVLGTHLAGSETFWSSEMIAGKKIDRDRDAEFRTGGTSSSELKRKLDQSGKLTQEALSSLREKELEEERQWRDRLINVRWCILHLITHFALHIGHMQLTRQLWLAKK